MKADGYNEELARIYREGWSAGNRRIPCKNPYGGWGVKADAWYAGYADAP